MLEVQREDLFSIGYRWLLIGKNTLLRILFA